MYRIGEFSKINRITVKTLRLYDEIGLLKPARVDESNGYRYYENSQIPLLHKIMSLKEIGFTLHEIKIILGEQRSTEYLLTKLEEKQDEIKKSISLDQSRVVQLSHYIDSLRKDTTMEYQIRIKDIPEVIVASMRKTISNYSELFELYPHMGERMKENSDKCAEPAYCFTLIHDDEYKESDIDIEICEAVTELKPDFEDISYRKIAAVPEAVCTYHKGPYSTIREAYRAILQWAEDNGYEITGEAREVGIDGIWNNDDEDKWLTEIQIPVAKK